MKIPAFSAFLMSVLTIVLLPIASGQPLEHTQEGFRLTRLLYENSLGEKGTTEFYYDADGHVSSAWWELTDRSKHSTNKYQYNHRGLLISVFREFSDNISSFEAYTYDDRGNRATERFCRSDRVRGTAVYHYDASGRRVRATFQRYKGWLDGEVAYQYGGAGRLLTATILNDLDTTGSITYEYDASGNLAREIWLFTQGWTQTFVYEYVPTTCRLWSIPDPLLTNTCQFRVVREEYMYNDTLGGPSTYEYAPEGFLARKTFTRSDGLKTVTTCAYDPERRLTRSVRRGGDGGESEFLYEYDRAGRMILRTQMSGGAVVSTEAYQYDGQGRVQRKIMQNVDNWLTGVVTYQSDSRGRLLKGHFRGFGAVAAALDLVYDADDCLREVIWRFSSGTVQRYTYTYERRSGR